MRRRPWPTRNLPRRRSSDKITKDGANERLCKEDLRRLQTETLWWALNRGSPVQNLCYVDENKKESLLIVFAMMTSPAQAGR